MSRVPGAVTSGWDGWKTIKESGRLSIRNAKGEEIGRQTIHKPGIEWLVDNPDLKGATFVPMPVDPSDNRFLKRLLGRTVTVPDILFSAEHLAPALDGVPVGWIFTGYDGKGNKQVWDVPQKNAVAEQGLNKTMLGAVTYNSSRTQGNSIEAFVGYAKIPFEPYSKATSSVNLGGGGSQTYTNLIVHALGPGHFAFPFDTPNDPSPYRYKMAFHKTSQNFEVLWSGESSVVGNIEGQPSLWGHIKGPGPKDYMTFPQSGTMSWVQNSILPQTKVPEIALVSDNGGTQPIEKNTLTRTLETLSITGEGMGSAKAIEIMNGDLILQRIMPVGQYIVSAQQIDLPPGIISLEAEGGARQIRVWNELGASISSEQKFNIQTGPPVITSTSADRIIHDRAQHLELTGYGFKSKIVGQTRLTHIRVDDENNNAVYDNGLANGGTSDGLPLQAPRLEVISDTHAILPQDTIGSTADGANRRLRVSRQTVANAQDVGGILSPPTNPLFTAITTKPVVISLQQLNSANNWEDVLSTGMFKRDQVLEINGTGLNTLSTLEIVQEDGTSFINPVFIQLPNAGVNVEDNGTRILMGADVIPWPDADTNSTAKRMFKLYNGVGNTDLNASQTFAVNIQPKVDALGGFAQPGYFNRDKVLGDDLLIYGSGLQAVSQVIFTDANDTSQVRLTLNVHAPGITATDTLISLDRQVYQLGNGADTDENSAQRILKLISARDDAFSSMNQRYRVGVPPTIITVGGIGGDGNYSRGMEILSVTGTGFGHVTQLEIVDTNGNPITGVPGLANNTGLNLLSTTSLNVDANATGWVNAGHLLDTVTANGRRVKVATPFGVVTSAEGFTMSAKPEFLATAQATFAGGGYDGGTNTYDQSEGNLYINGSNFRGVKQIVFYTGAGVNQGSITLDPGNPPLGIMVNTDGTRIFMDDSILPAGWIGSNTATIGLINIAGSDSNSTTIQTRE